MSAQVAADLRAAADVLERDGWTQGDYVDANGCRCADGAIVAAVGGDASRLSVPRDNRPRRDAAENALAAYIEGRAASLLATGHFLVQAWNDQYGRTESQVIAALRAAADKAEQA